MELRIEIFPEKKFEGTRIIPQEPKEVIQQK